MAYSFIQQSELSVASGTQLNVTAPAITPGTADVLFVCVLGNPNSTPTITDGAVGNTYNLRGSVPSFGGRGFYFFDCTNAANASTAVKAASTGIYAVYVGDYSGVGSYLNSVVTTFGGGGTTGANVITSGILTGISTGSLLWGFVCDNNGPGTSDGLTAGTSPTAFTGRTKVWGLFDAGLNSMAEDASVNANAATTFGLTANSFDSWYVVAAAYGPASSGAGTIIRRMNRSSSRIGTGT